MDETYAKIPGLDGYEVSNLGNMRMTDGKPVRTYISCTGYRFANIRSKQMRIARLVALAFIGPPPEGKPLVRHMDDDKLNDFAGNLEWTSYIEMANRPSRRRRISIGRMRPICMLNMTRDIRMMQFKSILHAVDWLRKNGHPSAGASHICNCCRGREKSCYGYRWSYVEEEE